MLQVSNLCFDYAYQPVLNDIHFSLQPGQLLHIRGENGKGKSTLLKLIAGLLTPVEGSIDYRGEGISYVGHKLGLSLALSVRENALLDIQGRSSADALAELLSQLSLSGLEDKLVSHLSAGQKRRVTLIRLFFSTAKLWVLDEPLVSLDDKVMHVFMGCIERQLQKGGMVVMASHQSCPFDKSYYLEYTL